MVATTPLVFRRIETTMNKDRLEAFSDGVIAITLPKRHPQPCIITSAGCRPELAGVNRKPTNAAGEVEMPAVGILICSAVPA
jgi:hypothetical protein